MIKIICLMALMACFCASAEITVTRDGSTDWICADADGVPLSNHTRIDKAFEACTNRTLLDGLVYRVLAGSTYRIQSDGVVVDPVDTDGDGVNDDVDQCPGTAAGVVVDASGCEIVVDSDGDGIPDVDDDCPNDATNTCNDPPPVGGGENLAIVYTRVPRSTEAFNFNGQGESFVSVRGDLSDTLPEVANTLSGYNAPGELIYRSRAGVEKILYSCGDCVPKDAKVSFDGKQVIFAAYRGKLEDFYFAGNTYPTKRLKSTHATLHIVDIATGVITDLPNNGDYDTHPIFTPQGTIIFASTRAKNYVTKVRGLTPSNAVSLQFYEMEIDGSNQRPVGSNDLDNAISPFVASDGRIFYSSWIMSGNHPWAIPNGGGQIHGTVLNKFWLVSTDSLGGFWESNLGAHSLPYNTSEGVNTVMAHRGVGERANSDICVGNYYRGNNFGAGDIHCFGREVDGVEGRSLVEALTPPDYFTPRNIYTLATWTTNFDSPAGKIDGKYTGKLRDPEGLDDGNVMVTFMRGPCSTVWGYTYSQILFKDEPLGCDGGIYKTTTIPSITPDDISVIVDRPEWHEFGARVAEPYAVVHGKNKPDFKGHKKDPVGRCFLATSDAMTREITNQGAYKWPGHSDWTLQGASSRKLLDDISGIQLYKLLPNTSVTLKFKAYDNIAGRPVENLGSAPINADGSWAAQVPCETPFIMAGVNSDGRIIAKDQVPMALRNGEIRTCGGCHLHSRPGKPMQGTIAQTQIDEGTAPHLITATPVPTWADVQPILIDKCAACHSDGAFDVDNPGPDADGSYEQIVFNAVDGLTRPMTSRYIHSGTSLESPLYWYFAGGRTDGRTNDELVNDIDYIDHNLILSPTSKALIGAWIDAGAPYNHD